MNHVWEVKETGSKFAMVCSCGYTDGGMETEKGAYFAGVQHKVKETIAWPE